MSTLSWAYGVMTVPKRKDTLLPRTLESLSNAGFEQPRLFVDGDEDVREWRLSFPTISHFTFRSPVIRVYGNWVLAAAELYIRQPHADLYAIFQDDFLASRNLRTYLERCEYPERGYWNLYTFPVNERLCQPGHVGWYPSNQMGKGAVGLVFNRETLLTLLTHQHMVDRPMDLDRGWRSVDGGIVTALKKAGWMEYVHSPSLIQHLGLDSTMDKRRKVIHSEVHVPTYKWATSTLSTTFRGVDFDLLSLLDNR